MNISQHIIPYSELTIEKARKGCFVTDMPNSEYHAYEGISNSGLKQIEQSPAHYALAEPEKQSDAKRKGSAIHCAILEPEVFKSDYLLLEDAKDRRCAAFNQAAKHHDKDLILTAGDIAQVQGMVDSCRANRGIQSYFNEPHYTELSGFIECPITGTLLRIRFDLLTMSGRAFDLKKTQDARKDAFEKAIYNYGYHQQAAFYNDVFAMIVGQPLECFTFGAVEEKSPHGSKAWRIDDVAMIMGREKYTANLETYAHCEKSGNWPAYDDAEEMISVPSWALFKEENDISEEII